jgi:hypothetical protein
MYDRRGDGEIMTEETVAGERQSAGEPPRCVSILEQIRRRTNYIDRQRRNTPTKWETDLMNRLGKPVAVALLVIAMTVLAVGCSKDGEPGGSLVTTTASSGEDPGGEAPETTTTAEAATTTKAPDTTQPASSCTQPSGW